MVVDGYIRVSRVAGRSGESFISPQEQRRAIEQYAETHGLEVGDWHEDLDQSGGTLDRPGFQAARDRCKSGATSGIIAAKLDRLTRSTMGLGILIDDARAGGWNLIAVDFGLDLFSPNGKLVADVLAAVAEWERGSRKQGWAVAQRAAVERGVPNGRPPFGYRKNRKNGGGRFEVVEDEAKLVREAFRKRAAGVTFTEIGRPIGMAHSTIRQMLSNVAYLGVARSGENMKEGAHEAIVTPAMFEAAQESRTTQQAPPGDTTRGKLLRGLARCAGCGRTLKLVRRKRADGSAVDAYYCKNQASEECPSRAYVHTDDLDSFVTDWFENALRTVPRMVDVVKAGLELERAQAEQRDAELELHAYIEKVSATEPTFRRGLDTRQARADETAKRVRMLAAQHKALPAGGLLIALWDGFDTDERQHVLGSYVGQVVVTRGASDNLAGNVRIFWTDGSPADDEDEPEPLAEAA